MVNERVAEEGLRPSSFIKVFIFLGYMQVSLRSVFIADQ